MIFALTSCCFPFPYLCTFRSKSFFWKLHCAVRPAHTRVDLCQRSPVAVCVIRDSSPLQKVLLHVSVLAYLCVFLMYEVLGLALWRERACLESGIPSKGYRFKLSPKVCENSNTSTLPAITVLIFAYITGGINHFTANRELNWKQIPFRRTE